MPPTDQTRGVPLGSLVRDASESAPDAFASRHGEAFLVYDPAALHAPEKSWKRTTVALSTGKVGAGVSQMLATMIAVPVRHSGRAASTAFIAVGRAGNNDVVLDDASVSSFHAFFHQDEDGEFYLKDAGSTNQTFVNGDPAPSDEDAQGLEVEAGDEVRFGAVAMTFMLAQQIVALAAELGEREATP